MARTKKSESEFPVTRFESGEVRIVQLSPTMHQLFYTSLWVADFPRIDEAVSYFYSEFKPIKAPE